MEQTRRRFLTMAGGVTAASTVAGCLDGVTGGSGEEGADAQASFFVFGDFATQVAGETATTETLVPLGQHGHGWEPGPRVRKDIRNAELLVHNMEGFQPWVDDILGDLEADDTDVAAVDVSSGIDLLESGAIHDQEEHHDGGHHEEETTHDGEDGHDEEDGHGHETMDPHFWMDPLRAKEAVSNVRQGLADIDPDNADAYEGNTAAYHEELDALDAELASLVANGEKSTILLAGHDAFQYLGQRYGIRFESLTGVSPDDQPTTRDIEQAHEIIAAHDIEYVCVDPLESQTAAETLVEDTAAREVLPLTSMPGLTEEWAGDGWGYLDVMENVNIPTLERALEAR